MQLNKIIYKLVNASMAANKNSACLNRLSSFWWTSQCHSLRFWDWCMKQFLPDQDKSSLRRSRAFPPSVSVSNNHAGVCARFFMETLLKYRWKDLSVHCRSVNRLWYNGTKWAGKCRTLWMCLDQGWIRPCRELWGKKADCDTVFKQ